MQKLTKIFALALLTLLPTLGLSAQNVKITGTVTDGTGLSVIAATVYQEGNTSNGTITDMDGHYSITVPADANLVFSCLGYMDQTQAVAGRSVIDVVLADDAVTLEAAQVVSDGYNTVAKRDLTGSVSSVSMDNLVKTPVTSFSQALGGRVAGVVSTTSDGSVGASANITIRGNNSLTQSNEPLYIIDGFPSESSMASSISPADIENIDILKDASATAIYGARGANGVIVITTKQGSEGKPKINFLGTWTLNHIANKVDLMDAYDFVALQTEIATARNSSNSYLYDSATAKTYNLDDYKNVNGVDWQDQIYRTALVQNYNLSISGGNAKAGNIYNVSLGVTQQDGIIVNSSFERYQGKISFQQKIYDNLQMNLMGNFSRAVSHGTNPTSAQQSSSASGWLMYSVWGYRPTRPLSQIEAGLSNEDMMDDLTDSDAASSNDYRFNPAKTVRNEYRRSLLDNINGNISFLWTINDELKLKASAGYTQRKTRSEAFNDSNTYTGYPGSPSGKGVNSAIGYTDVTSWINDYVLTWTKTLKKAHHVQMQGITSMQGNKTDYFGTSSTQMTTEALGIYGLNTGELQVVDPSESSWRMLSFAYRLNYNYKYRYYLTFSMRADGSSKFPAGNRWGYFPSGSVAWNFNRESWMQQFSWLNNGKVRLSWGKTGNNRIGAYTFYSTVSTNPGSATSFDYIFDGTSVAGYYPSSMANEKLKWETTTQTDLGLDLGFFQNRIKITTDYYVKNTDDLLLAATIPASSGYTSATLNIGSMQNKGWEFTLEAIPVQNRDFQWESSFNIAFNRNKVTGLTDDQFSLLRAVSWDQSYNSQYAYITQVGKPTGMMYGYIYEGTYKAEDFNAAGTLLDGVPYMSSVGKTATQPGDPKYRDINGDGVIDDNDRTIIGCGQPIHTGGFNNTFYYKNFDLNIFFQWSYGNDVLNANKLVFEDGTRINLNQFTSYKDRFNAETNPNSDIPRVMANGMSVYSSRVIEDGSFLRLKNITLGYTFPARVLQKLRLSAARVYISAENIWTLTNYSGPDPEVSTRESVLTPGFDWSAYARAYGITGGISFTF